ncbi:MAG TPA: glycosyltransferase [Chitinophagales bacterium]|nr:glycosyltransferase [Chitinophagales bacterium]
MPKVLRIINRLNLGGPTYNAAYLSRYINRGYETLLLAGMKDETEASSEFILKNMGITPVYIPEMFRPVNPVRDWQAYRRIQSIIRDYKPDIVHTHAAKAGALGRLAARHCNVPVIVHTFHGHVFHSYFTPLKTNFFIRAERYFASISSAIVAISNLQKRELSEVFRICPPEKITVIPLGFELDRFQAGYDSKRSAFRIKYHVDDDTLAIGIVGRLVPVKNHPLFLRAFKRTLEKTSRKIKAFIIGDGEERENLMQIAKQLDLPFDASGKTTSSPLVFTSWLTNIDEVMAGLDMVALTSFNEGTPVSLIEAQAAGKAIVATAVGGIEDVVIPGITALLSPAGDLDELAANMVRLAEDDALRKRLGQQGFQFVRNRFDYTALVKNMADLYDRLLNSAASARR